MEREFVDAVVKVAADELDIELTPHYDYSGRGMHGETCHGIVGESTAAIAVCIGYLCGQRENDVPNWSQDNMGKDAILY